MDMDAEDVSATQPISPRDGQSRHSTPGEETAKSNESSDAQPKSAPDSEEHSEIE